MKGQIYIVLGMLVFCLASQTLFADDSSDALFLSANKAYTTQDYPRAIALYDSVYQGGFESVGLYFNLGNAYFRTGQVGKAILNYERALELDPSHEDAQFNLRLANLRVVDNVETVPEFMVVRLWREFVNGRSSGSWGILALILLWVALGFSALFLWTSTSNLKRLGFFGGILCLLISLSFLSVSLFKRGAEKNNLHGIILAPNAYVKASPDGTAKDLLILHEGVKVEILRENAPWTEIKIADSKIDEVVGWVAEKDVEKI